MNNMLLRLVWGLTILIPASVRAEELPAPPPSWHAHTLWEAVAYMVLFAAIGIAVAVIGYKVFDRCTPGNLHREIFENKNVAAAVVAGAVILGLCIIVAAAMLG
jgi:uncharacterized membrane protein YjfL (UPF0719 family)